MNDLGLGWNSWYTGRAHCRRLGGDLPTERQWEGVPSGGAGGFEQGPRPHPWGARRAAASTSYQRHNNRSGKSAWLGVTPEGLADLTSNAVSYGEWTLEQGNRASGTDPQSGHRAGSNGAFFMGWRTIVRTTQCGETATSTAPLPATTTVRVVVFGFLRSPRTSAAARLGAGGAPTLLELGEHLVGVPFGAHLQASAARLPCGSIRKVLRTVPM